MNNIPILIKKTFENTKYSSIFCDNSNLYLISKATKTIDKYDKEFSIVNQINYNYDIKDISFDFNENIFYVLNNSEAIKISILNNEFELLYDKKINLNFTPDYIRYDFINNTIKLYSKTDSISLEKDTLKPIKNSNQISCLNNITELIPYKIKNNIEFQGLENHIIIDICNFENNLLYFLSKNEKNIHLSSYDIKDIKSDLQSSILNKKENIQNKSYNLFDEDIDFNYNFIDSFIEANDLKINLQDINNSCNNDIIFDDYTSPILDTTYCDDEHDHHHNLCDDELDCHHNHCDDELDCHHNHCDDELDCHHNHCDDELNHHHNHCDDELDCHHNHCDDELDCHHNHCDDELDCHHNNCDDELDCHHNHCDDELDHHHHCNKKCCCHNDNCCLNDNCCEVVHSIALIEVAIAHVLNSEGEKIQKIVATSNSVCEILEVNNSVIDVIDKLVKLEMLLCDKLKLVEKLSNNPKNV